MNTSEAFRQIDAAIKLAEEALDAGEGPFRDSGQYAESITVCASTIERLTARDSVYPQHAKRILNRVDMGSPYFVEQLLGVLKGLRRDIDAGYLLSLEEEAHADLFSDFLEMADQLLKDRHVLPAAVVAGSALEAQLRALAERSHVSTQAAGRPKRAAKLNDDLAKKGIYRKAEQKQILAWQDIRNSAAHGEAEFSIEQVRLMVQGIRDFIKRHPA